MTPSEQYAEVEQHDQRDLVLQHADLVKRIAYHLIGRLPANVEVEDLIQAGTIGLMMAGRNYSASKGANFETYAGIRIRGAMIDEVRKSDWTPRSVHRKIREVTATMSEIENRTNGKAKDQEVADAMGISAAEYRKIVRDAAACKLFSLDGPSTDESATNQIPSTTELDPARLIEEESRRRQLIEFIDLLPERERLVMSMYYDDELTFREIGEVLNVSESRVCQIHGQALLRLRSKMAD